MVTDVEQADQCFSPGGAAAQVEAALGLLDGRWKLTIVFHLFAKPVLRFSELERAVEGVSQRMLAKQLRDLARAGLVSRTVYAEVPPRVEYRLTGAGEELRPMLQRLREWYARNGDEGGAASRE